MSSGFKPRRCRLIHDGRRILPRCRQILSCLIVDRSQTLSLPVDLPKTTAAVEQYQTLYVLNSCDGNIRNVQPITVACQWAAKSYLPKPGYSLARPKNYFSSLLNASIVQLLFHLRLNFHLSRP